jgi:hypothetical protein
MMGKEKQNGILDQPHDRLFGEGSLHVFNRAVETSLIGDDFETPRQSNCPPKIDINESVEQRRNLRWHLSDIERGKREVGIITLQVIARDLDTTMANLLKGL